MPSAFRFFQLLPLVGLPIILFQGKVDASETVPLSDGGEQLSDGEETGVEAPARNSRDTPGLYCESSDPSKPEPACIRGAAGAGLVLGKSGASLSDVTKTFGAGFQFYLGFSPRRWPVIGGLQLDYIDYGGPIREFTWQGITDRYRIGSFSHQGLAMVRLAPERFVIRPYLDLLGGYWLLATQIREGKGLFDDTTDSGALGSHFVGAYGARVGLDILFRKDWGLGLAVQWTRGSATRMVNADAIQVIDGALVLPEGDRVIPQQLHFSVNLVYDSWGGNWKVRSGGKVRGAGQ